MPYVIDNPEVNAYYWRCIDRQTTLMTATMLFIEYFVSLGDDRATAEAKVTQVSTEVSAYLYVYTLGNNIPLFDGINNSQLPFMDANAKAFLIGKLTLIV